MTKKQAKALLAQILTQKTVSIPKLKWVLDVLDYNKLEQDYIRQGIKLKKYKRIITDQNIKINNQRNQIRRKKRWKNLQKTSNNGQWLGIFTQQIQVSKL